jgi:two-component system nitrogen regulation response regulator GlnG
LLELANGATVFFDEIGDIPLTLQVKLLRVLETHEITPVGATGPRRTDFRVIAATNRPLEEAIRSETFRRDLFFRLAGFEISLRPLRERQEDIPVLAEHFLRGARVTPPPSGFTDEAKKELLRRTWYGNVRELRNAIEHAAIMARGLPIARDHFPAGMELGNRSADDPLSRIRAAIHDWATARLQAGEHANLYEQCLAQIEPPLFEAVLHHTQDNRAAAAEILGIHRATLRKKMG